MFLWRNIKVARNFAGMLLVACKQHMLLLETLKSYDSAVHVISKWKRTKCKYRHSAAVWAYIVLWNPHMETCHHSPEKISSSAKVEIQFKFNLDLI